jgi:hypothetical protein
MNRRPARQTFAEIVGEVESTPIPAAEPTGPGLGRDGVFTDPVGRQYTCVAEDLSPGRALELATAGAVVVWDPCGCEGYCAYEWFSAEEVRDMVASGPPSIRNNRRHRGTISEWRSASGAVLLLAEEAVTWAGRMG